MILQKTARQI